MTRDDLYIVLVTGSREWTDAERILIELRHTRHLAGSRKVVVVHGDCRGADSIADKIAVRLGMHVCRIPAQWDTHPKRAGPIRNSVMCALFEFDYVIALPLGKSKGTKDCLTKARIRNG
jgi:hypothetical protein